MKIKKIITGIALTFSLVGITTFASTEVKADSGIIYLQNGSGSNRITGVWIEVDGGGSGWANYTRRFDGNYNWSFNIPNGRKWKANVGVNGTRQNWAISANSINWSTRQGNGLDIQVYRSSFGWRTVVPR